MIGGNWILIVCLILVSLAFVCLVVFACIFLFSAAKSLKSVQKDVTNISEEVSNLIHHTDNIIEGFVPYSNMMGSVGKTIEKKVSSSPCCSCSKGAAEGEEYLEEPQGVSRFILDAADLVHTGVHLWEKIKSRR